MHIDGSMRISEGRAHFSGDAHLRGKRVTEGMSMYGARAFSGACAFLGGMRVTEGMRISWGAMSRPKALEPGEYTDERIRFSPLAQGVSS